MPASVLVLIGLPGSGKTTFCRRYQQYLAKKSNPGLETTELSNEKPTTNLTLDDSTFLAGNSGHARFVHVDYDRLVPLHVQAGLKDRPGEWKQTREKILQAVEFHIQRLQAKSCQTSLADMGELENTTGTVSQLQDSVIDHEPDQQANDAECLDDTLQSLVDQESGSGPANSPSPATDISSNEFTQHLLPEFDRVAEVDLARDNLVIVVDDNNYLRSMRSCYHQLARRNRIGFCQIYFQCDVTTAVSLNNKRTPECRIDQTVIEAMHCKLEAPDPLCNPWERFSFSLAVNDSYLGEDEQHSINWDIVDTVVNLSIANPESPVEDKTEERDRDRIVCSASIVHQADNHLRAEVNRHMKSLRETPSLSSEERRGKSATILEAKKEVLEDLKTGFVRLDRDLVASVEQRRPESGKALREEMASLLMAKLNLNI